jgi:exosortase
MPGEAGRNSIFGLSPVAVFSILVALSLAIWWSPLVSSLALAWRDDRYTHILLIIPVSVALVLLEWKPSLSLSFDSSRAIGSALLAIAVSITSLARWKSASLSSDVDLSLNMLALILWWMAAFVFCFGLRASCRSIFPLGFLLWLIPLPESVMNPIIGLLQQGSALAAHVLFWVAGVPVEQSGMLVHIPGLTLEVAPECSSIRSSLMLVVTTMVLAQLLLGSPWRKALIVAVAIPLSVAKNGLRIFTIAMLGTRVDAGFLTGRFHRQGGIIFFLVALAIIFLLLWIARRGDAATGRRGDEAETLKQIPASA